MNTTLILEVGLILLQGIGIVLAVDFISGVVHWLEDSYGRKEWPLLGKWIIEPNIRHHFEPRHFTKSSFWQRNSATLVLSVLVLGVVTLAGGFHWGWLLAAAIGGMTNEIHCWAHRSPRENGRVITFLQKAHFLQSPRGHATHHTDPKDRSYCTVTDWLNPLLDYFEVFARLESLIFRMTGLPRRVDESVKALRVKSPCGGSCQVCGRCAARTSSQKAA